MLDSTVKFWTKKKVLTTLILIVIAQAIISYKSLQIIFLKEDLLKKTTNNINNPYIQDQNEWLASNSSNQVVMIVIDALGHYLAEPHLTVLKDIMQKEPNNSIFLKSKTDSLTVTGPRLLSIMTGTNPTVIDLIQNVEHSEETKIDNILQKMNDKNKTVFFTGDNTWLKLFPKAFTNFTNDNSFNVFDYFQQDRNNMAYVMNSMDTKIKNGNEEKGVDLIISHFLGIDHIFHSRGNVHDQLAYNKYIEYGDFINQVIEKLGDRTLIIQSDHGATPRGTHGDDSPEETEAFFFAYRKKGFSKNSKIVKELLQEVPSYPINMTYLNDRIQISQKNEVINPQGNLQGILQLDLAVNLANILGLSLPYQSLGMIWPIFYNGFKEGDAVEEGKFKNIIANDCFTVVKQQIQILRENQVYHDKLGQERLDKFYEGEEKIDQYYNDYLESNQNLDKLKVLYKNAFDLNMQIKEALSGNASKQMKNKLIEMSFLGISVLLFILFIAIRLNEYHYSNTQSTSSPTNQKLASSSSSNSFIFFGDKSKNLEVDKVFDNKKLIGLAVFSLLVYILFLLDFYNIASYLIYFMVFCIFLNVITTVKVKRVVMNYLLNKNILIIFQIWLNYYIISLQSDFFQTHDADIFKILITSFTMYLVLNYFRGFFNLLAMFIIVLLAQYSIKDPSTKSCPSLNNFPQGYFEFPELKSILNSTIVSVIIPAIICFYSLQKFIFGSFPANGTEVYKRYKFLLNIQFNLSFYFILITDIFPDLGNSHLILVHLPRLQILLFIYQNYHYFFEIPKQIEQKSSQGFQQIQLTKYGKLLLVLLNFMSLNLIYIGQKSFYATALFFSFLFFYRRYLNSVHERNSFLQILILFIISFFFFFVTDHKYGFGNLQIKAGYIGMGEYVEFYALIFITINTITWQLYTLASYPIFCEGYSHQSFTTIIFKVELLPNSARDLQPSKTHLQTEIPQQAKIRLRLDYIYFVFLFAYKYFFILGKFAFSLGNDQAHKTLPFLIGEIMFSNVGYALAIIAFICIHYAFQKQSNIKSI